MTLNVAGFWVATGRWNLTRCLKSFQQCGPFGLLKPEWRGICDFMSADINRAWTQGTAEAWMSHISPMAVQGRGPHYVRIYGAPTSVICLCRWRFGYYSNSINDWRRGNIATFFKCRNSFSRNIFRPSFCTIINTRSQYIAG